MRIAIVDSGYVGLVSGACLSDFGHGVVCVDKIDALKRGVMPIYQPGLDRLVTGNVEDGRLCFTPIWRRPPPTRRPCSSRSARLRAEATGRRS